MFHDTSPARLDDHAGMVDPWAPYRIQRSIEMHTLLRQVRDASAPVLLASPRGVSTTCTLWAMDSVTERLTFSADDNQPQLAELVQADETVAVTYLDSVKLQFELEQLILVRGKQGVALQSSMPHCIYRFQRRDSFRVRPLSKVAPQLTLRHPAMPDMLLQLRILDLSVGGCAVLVPAGVPELQPGVVIHGVQVELDAETAFVAGLVLHHVSSHQDSDHGSQIGCQWQGLEPFAERALQRYINQTQKRQRLLSLS